MLRLQNERMKGALLPSAGEFFKHYGLTPEKLALAKPDAIVMHPGPMNRGVEIDSAVADGDARGDPAAGDVRHRGADGGDEHARRANSTMKIEIANGRVDRPEARRSTASASLYIAAGTDRGDRRGARRLERQPRHRRARAASSRPGLVDLSARLREPGFEYKATLESEMAAAVAGGVTSLACPPDTDPPLDEPGLVEMLKHRARVAQPGARLSGRRADRAARRATTLTEMGELTEAGCVAFSQADAPLVDTQVLLRAMQYAATFGYRVWLRPQDPHLGTRRRRARRRGRDAPRPAGDSRRRRDDRAGDDLRAGARDGRARAPVPAVVRPRASRMVRAAKARGPAGHLRRRRPSPAPVRRRHRLVRLRSATSCRRCAARATAPRCAPGVADGTIDLVCSDHTPVDDDGKQVPFGEAEPGATGLELLLPLTLKWAREDERAAAGGARARSPRRRPRLLGCGAGTSAVGGAGRRLRVRSGRALDGRARRRCAARARTRRSSDSRFRAACATRWSAGRSCTRAESVNESAMTAHLPNRPHSAGKCSPCSGYGSAWRLDRCRNEQPARRRGIVRPPQHSS